MAQSGLSLTSTERSFDCPAGHSSPLHIIAPLCRTMLAGVSHAPVCFVNNPPGLYHRTLPPPPGPFAARIPCAEFRGDVKRAAFPAESANSVPRPSNFSCAYLPDFCTIYGEKPLEISPCGAISSFFEGIFSRKRLQRSRTRASALKGHGFPCCGKTYRDGKKRQGTASVLSLP